MKETHGAAFIPTQGVTSPDSNHLGLRVNRRSESHDEAELDFLGRSNGHMNVYHVRVRTRSVLSHSPVALIKSRPRVKLAADTQSASDATARTKARAMSSSAGRATSAFVESAAVQPRTSACRSVNLAAEYHVCIQISSVLLRSSDLAPDVQDISALRARVGAPI